MLRLLACVVLLPAIARADSEPAFNENYVCTDERGDANQAADQVRGASKSQAAAVAAKRDKTAKALSECISRERSWHEGEAEKRRLKAEAEAREQERLRALMSNRSALHVALSAKLCVDAADRAASLREVAAEKKYARVGGVQNMSKLYDLQQNVRNLDERKVEWQKGLKNLKLKALGCSSDKIKPVVVCIQGATGDPSCAVASVAEPVEAAGFLELHGLGPLARPDAHKNVTPGP